MHEELTWIPLSKRHENKNLILFLQNYQQMVLVKNLENFMLELTQIQNNTAGSSFLRLLNNS